MKKELDWKGVGQFVAFLVSVFAIVRDTFKKMKINPEIIPWLTEDGKEIFEKCLQSLGEEWLKKQKIVATEAVHIIDCDADPYLPDRWIKVIDHKKSGQLRFDPSRISLCLSESQKRKMIFVGGGEIRRELSGRLVLNANVLDYLLAHTELIPEQWKGKCVFFWGTTYRCWFIYRLVRCLRWNGSKWTWCFYPFNFLNFHYDDPAAVYAN